jgi:hypothetical protein
VSTRERDQRGDRIRLLIDQSTHLAPPCPIDPLDYGPGEVLLALELVIKGATRVSGLACDLLEHEVAVAVARQTPSG